MPLIWVLFWSAACIKVPSLGRNVRFPIAPPGGPFTVLHLQTIDWSGLSSDFRISEVRDQRNFLNKLHKDWPSSQWSGFFFLSLRHVCKREMLGFGFFLCGFKGTCVLCVPTHASLGWGVCLSVSLCSCCVLVFCFVLCSPNSSLWSSKISSRGLAWR